MSRCFVAFLFLIFFISCTCSKKQKEIDQKVVVKVNDEVLNLKDFAEKLSKEIKQFDVLSAKNPQNINRIKEKIIQEFIIKSITKSYAKENGIKIEEEELNQKINEIRSYYPDDISFREILAEENISFEKWKKQIYYSLLEKKIYNFIVKAVSAPTEEELRNYYNTNKELFKRNDQIYLKQILLDKKPSAELILKKLKKGSDFSDMAKKHSISVESKKGGILGWIDKKDLKMFKVDFDLPLRKISKIHKSDYGYHIFYILKKRKAGYISFNEVKEKIKQNLLNDRSQVYFTAWLDQQIRKAKIYKDHKLVSSLVVETKDF